MIERNKDGSLTENSKAALAIKGMPPGPLADKLGGYEKQLFDWLGVEVNDEGHVMSRKWFTKFRSAILTLTPMRLFRQEMADLVMEYRKLQSDARAAGVQAEFYKTYLELVEEKRQLWRFLFENFRNHLEEGQTLNLPLGDIAKRIMMQYVGDSPAPAPQPETGRPPAVEGCPICKLFPNARDNDTDARVCVACGRRIDDPKGLSRSTMYPVR